MKYSKHLLTTAALASVILAVSGYSAYAASASSTTTGGTSGPSDPTGGPTVITTTGGTTTGAGSSGAQGTSGGPPPYTGNYPTKESSDYAARHKTQAFDGSHNTTKPPVLHGNPTSVDSQGTNGSRNDVEGDTGSPGNGSTGTGATAPSN